MKDPKPTVTQSVERTGDRSLALKTTVTFGDEGIPLDQLSNAAEEMDGVAVEPAQPVAAAPPAAPAPPRPGRNEPCYCGSDKKYQQCCLPKDEEAARRAAAAKAAAQIPERGVLRRPVTPAPATPPPAPEWPDLEEDGPDDYEGADNLPPELKSQFDALWDGFLALEQPTAEQMDALLDGLLKFPPDATSWSDLFHRFASNKHPDLPAVFRRISGSVAHTHAAGMCYFYWAAAEEFVRADQRELLPEVATNYRKLDASCYDADALHHLEDWLLADGFEAETLTLGEHFLPILIADDGLLPHAVPELANLIFELRVGRHFRAGVAPATDVETLAAELRRDLEEDIDPEVARSAAVIIAGQSPPPAWSRAAFALVVGDISKSSKAWQDCLRLYRTLLHVAREAWQVEQYPPGCALRGLSLLLNSVYRAQENDRKKSKKAAADLLDHLLPAGLEARLVQSSHDLIGMNLPRARLLLDSHGILLRFAERHQLLSEADVTRSRQNLERLSRELEGGGRNPSQPE